MRFWRIYNCSFEGTKLLIMKLQVLLFCLLNIQLAITQTCPQGSVFINTQAQVEAFASQYPNCEELPEGLSIMGADVVSLEGFNNIKSILGSFSISNTENLKNLEGLNNLEIIHDFIRIQGNPGLQSFEGLENLRKVNSEYFYISSNPRMKSLDGLQNLDSIAGKFQLFFLDSLQDINALSQLSYVGGDLMIFQNLSLSNINGLQDLKNINALRVYENPNLSDITSLSPDLTITEWLVISDNPLLSECNVTSVCAHLNNPDAKSSISGNMTGCANKSEVLVACNSSSTTSNNYQKINVFPNPSENFLILEGEIKIDNVEIVNLQGQKSLLPINNQRIETSALIPGVYIGLIHSKSNNYYFKFLKK